MASQPQVLNGVVGVAPAEDTWTSPLLPGHTVAAPYVEPNKFPSAYLETRTTLSREIKALAKSSVRLPAGHAWCTFH